jgi:hypothetical protein
MQQSLKPVQVVAEDEREFTFLTLGLLSSGIRLIGLCGLLGQKVRVRIPNPDGAPWCFVMRILWTRRIGDDLIENGGAFLVGNECPGRGQPPAGPATGASATAALGSTTAPYRRISALTPLYHPRAFRSFDLPFR